MAVHPLKPIGESFLASSQLLVVSQQQPLAFLCLHMHFSKSSIFIWHSLWVYLRILFPLCISVSVSKYLLGTQTQICIEGHQSQPIRAKLNDLILTTSVKILFPKKVTFQSTRSQDLFERHNSTRKFFRPKGNDD